MRHCEELLCVLYVASEVHLLTLRFQIALIASDSCRAKYSVFQFEGSSWPWAGEVWPYLIFAKLWYKKRELNNAE